MARPVLFVLAGANGAGKSSIGGRLFRSATRRWFDADTYARHLIERDGAAAAAAGRRAGIESIRRFRTAIARRQHYASETTLGGHTMRRKLIAAADTHDVVMWFCGLASVELHIARVKSRAMRGGHDVPESRIRQRYATAPRNLIALLPYLWHLQVYDNSETVPVGQAVPDPRLVLDLTATSLIHPRAGQPAGLRQTPTWAIPIVEAALQLHERRVGRD